MVTDVVVVVRKLMVTAAKTEVQAMGTMGTIV